MSRGLCAQVGLNLDGFVVQVHVTAEPGETVAIVGPNGAGKSSTLRAIGGLEPLTSGRIKLADRVLDDPEAPTFVPADQRRIGTVFQDPLLFPHLRVVDNVGFGIGGTRRERRDGARRWLERVGLTGFEPRRVADLSGGEARRVAIARALASGPELVVLDEPFAGLDVTARAAVRRLLVDELQIELAQVPRLLVTHDPADAQTLADRVVVIEAGQVTQTGTPDDIRRHPATRYVADLVGLNLIRGVATAGRVAISGTDIELSTADRSVDGSVVVTAAPHAVALYRDPPSGSPRNSWPATVGELHHLGDITRVSLDTPVPLVAEVTPSAVADLAIVPGANLWVSIKATSLTTRPAARLLPSD